MRETHIQPPRIEFLYTDIGRGHPSYLDGIIEALVRRGEIGLVRGETDVFAVSSGLSKLAWRLARGLYHVGSSGGSGARLYNRLRSDADYNRPGVMLRLLGRSIARTYMSRPWPLVVAHPILVAILKGKQQLLYQHGELATPSESLVRGASRVLAPTGETARAFVESGYAPKDVVVTGLCIEPSLVRQAEDAFESRLERLRSIEERTGAFFSSGAEPKSHVRMLTSAIESIVRSGGRAILFAQRGGRFQRAAVTHFERRKLRFSVLDDREPMATRPEVISVVTFASRRELAHRTAQLFPEFDYFVAPAHERSNWALGLGLPMFIVGPQIGSFAPLNREHLISAGVAKPLETINDARDLGTEVNGRHTIDSLVEMAQVGWGRHPVNGFEKIAEFLVAQYATANDGDC